MGADQITTRHKLHFRTFFYFIGSLFVSVTAYSNEEPRAFVKFFVGNDNRVSIVVPSTSDNYYVLYYRRDSTNAETEIPVAMQFGNAGSTTLSESLAIGSSSGLYRVQAFRINEPGDIDGDGRNDVEELADTTGRLSPLNPADPVVFIDGVVTVLDRQMYRDLSYQGQDVRIDTHLKDLEFVKFYVFEADTANPEIYFMNTVTHRAHREFSGAIGTTPCLHSILTSLPNAYILPFG